MLIIYIGVKLTLYALWRRYGIRLLSPLGSASAYRVVGLTLVRLVLGLVLGSGWAMLLAKLVPSEEYSRLGFDPYIFVAGLLAVRWLAWSGISFLLRPRLEGWRCWGQVGPIGCGGWAGWGSPSPGISSS